MKKSVFLLIAILSISITSIGQDYKEIKSSELPKKIHEYFSKNLKGVSMGRAAKSIDNNQVRYAVVGESRGRKSVFIFDKDGNFISRESKLPQKSDAKPGTTPAKSATPPDNPKK